VPSALLVRGVGDLALLPAVAEGRATPQDQASQAVAAAVGARPGETVLDMAAAPGGKATALAEAMGDEGLVVAADLRPGRAGRVVAYCVCTLTREETLDVDEWAAGAFPALTAVTGPGAPWRPHGRGSLLLPTAADTDGMFLLLLRAPIDKPLTGG